MEWPKRSSGSAVEGRLRCRRCIDVNQDASERLQRYWSVISFCQRERRTTHERSAELVHAQEDERRTIGRDLHDEIGQALMTIKLDLGAIERSSQVSGAARML